MINGCMCHVCRMLKRTLFKEELEANWPGPDKVWLRSLVGRVVYIAAFSRLFSGSAPLLHN